MKINNLDLQGFKSFVAESITFNQLTLLTGLNSSGKSSIIQALLMLGKATQKQDSLLEGHGDIEELKNKYCEEVSLELSFENDSLLRLKDTEISSEGEVQFPKIIHISADRFGAELFSPIFSGNNYDLGKKGENIFKCIEKNENELLPEAIIHPNSEGETFLFNLRAWLGVISPNIKFDYQIQSLSDTAYGTFNGYRAKNVGFGLSYTLPVITALLLGAITPDSLVIIENPEAHLHPRGQSEIAKLISLCAEVGTQIVIETHSDHIFDAIRIHAKESKNNFHTLVNAYWFELDAQLNTEVETVSINENGRLDNYPQGFFDQFEMNARKLL